MRIGIVGNGKDKFSTRGEERARAVIRSILAPGDVVVSGHSPMGGVDIWAEEIGIELGLQLDIKVPQQRSWDGEYGYKARNLDIAASSDVVHVIVADRLPIVYRGRRFEICYHCHRNDHVKSGACWTGKQAQKMGKEAIWHIIENE